MGDFRYLEEDRRYTDREVARLQASEAKLVLDGFKARLRDEFLRLLVTDSDHHDRRRKDYNQAIFMDNGRAIWTETDLPMVMDKFDQAVRNLR